MCVYDNIQDVSTIFDSWQLFMKSAPRYATFVRFHLSALAHMHSGCEYNTWADFRCAAHTLEQKAGVS